VQADALLRMARELAREAKAPPPAYLPWGWLVERLARAAAAGPRRVAGRFAAFARRASRRRWKKLIAHAGKAAAAAPAPDAAGQPGEEEAHGAGNERKFLVAGDGWREGARGVRYRQGYLSAGERAGCTVASASPGSGRS